MSPWETCTEYIGLDELPYQLYMYGCLLSLCAFTLILVPTVVRPVWRRVIWRWPYSVMPMMVVSWYFSTFLRFLFLVIQLPLDLEEFCCEAMPILFVFALLVTCNTYFLGGFVLLRFILKPLDNSLNQRRSVIVAHILVYGSAAIITAFAVLFDLLSSGNHCENTFSPRSAMNGPALKWMHFLDIPVIISLLFNVVLSLYWKVVRWQYQLLQSNFNILMRNHFAFIMLTCSSFAIALLCQIIDPFCTRGSVDAGICRALYYCDGIARGWVPILISILFLVHPVVKDTLFEHCCPGWQRRVHNMLGAPVGDENALAMEQALLPRSLDESVDLSTPPLLPLEKGSVESSPIMSPIQEILGKEGHYARREVLRIRHHILSHILQGVASVMDTEVEKYASIPAVPLTRTHTYKSVVGLGISKTTRDIKITTHAPARFQYLRALFGVTDSEVSESMKNCLDSIDPVSLQGGKSGQFCFLTGDGRFIIKTIVCSEYKVVLKTIDEYSNHIANNRQSLMARYLGLYTIHISLGGMLVLLMDNVLAVPRDITPHMRFDLKGSLIGRYTNFGEHVKSSHTYKDGDFHTMGLSLNLSHEDAASFYSIVQADAKFFRDSGIVDYSLLLGIFKKSELTAEEWGDIWKESFSANSYTPGRLWRSEDGETMMVMGIIDFLQEWTLDKKIEYMGKSIMHPLTGKGTSASLISAVNSSHYATRFVQFMSRISGIDETSHDKEAV